jgi:carbonic anhydrase
MTEVKPLTEKFATASVHGLGAADARLPGEWTDCVAADVGSTIGVSPPIRQAEENPAVSGAAAARLELERMLADNRMFAAASHPTQPPSTPELRHDLASNGQKPKVTIIACSDSRVPPEVLFRAKVGDMFVIRTAGNIAKDLAVLASVEFGILNLKTSLILVLGHEKCGAVTAAINYKKDPDAFASMSLHLKSHVANIADSIDLSNVEQLDNEALVASVVESHTVDVVHSLRSECACVRESEEKGHILLAAGVYDLTTGQVRIVGN